MQTTTLSVVFSRMREGVLSRAVDEDASVGWWQRIRIRTRPLTPAIGFLVTTIGFIATLLALYRDPDVYRLLFGRGHMTGDLNIAVAQFNGLDDQGRVVRMEAADALASSMYSFLDDELQQLNKERFNIEIWPPSRTGTLKGKTPEERASAAAALTEAIGADIVVYSVLVTENNTSSVRPEFYIADSKLSGAEELSGAHSLGSVIRAPGDTTNPATKHTLNERLLARTGALAQFVVGLGYFANGDHSNATKYFQAAESTQGWEQHDGKELLYLFLGTAALHGEDLAAAEAFYTQALQLNPTYARAQLGLGEVQFLRARQAACEPGQTDIAGVEQAATLYLSALEMAAPAEAKIAVKTAAFTGRAYLCLTRAGVDRRADAERELRAVINAYAHGNNGLRDLAAEAHANLGLLNLTVLATDSPTVVRQRYRDAAAEYQEAITLSRRPEWQAYYSLSLTFIYLSLDECADAFAAWEQAASFERTAARPNPSLQPWRAYIDTQWTASTCSYPTATP